MIYVLDYGAGNVGSVTRMIEHVGGQSRRVTDPASLADAEKIVLPGVGAFDHGMSLLRSAGWDDALNEAVLERSIPILGICLGMQLMCKTSEEGRLPGFGWIDAEVKRFAAAPGSDMKIPHMGWNVVKVAKENPLLPMGAGEWRFYFVHSYYAVCSDSSDILATAEHGQDFVAAFSRQNIFGAQFHPEKSHRFGMHLMQNFVEMQC
jgi:glutamine amidotransferase